MNGIINLRTEDLMRILQTKSFGYNFEADTDKLLDAVFRELDSRFTERGEYVRDTNLVGGKYDKYYVVSKMVDGISVSTYKERDAAKAKSYRKGF